LVGKGILEIGCGNGAVLNEYSFFGAASSRLFGIDLLSDRIQIAHADLPKLPLSCADAQYLPYRSNSFDLVLQYTVFSSILDMKVKMQIAQEILRVIRKPGGLILWYDFWINPTNPQTHGIRPAEIRALFPQCSFTFRKITLAPPISRLLAPGFWFFCLLLENLRILNTHYLVAICPNA
jgi:ubiquinone/menaquinone biosynthesis C-methylase UbiE